MNTLMRQCRARDRFEAAFRSVMTSGRIYQAEQSFHDGPLWQPSLHILKLDREGEIGVIKTRSGRRLIVIQTHYGNVVVYEHLTRVFQEVVNYRVVCTWQFKSFFEQWYEVGALDGDITEMTLFALLGDAALTENIGAVIASGVFEELEAV